MRPAGFRVRNPQPVQPANMPSLSPPLALAQPSQIILTSRVTRNVDGVGVCEHIGMFALFALVFTPANSRTPGCVFVLFNRRNSEREILNHCTLNHSYQSVPEVVSLCFTLNHSTWPSTPLRLGGSVQNAETSWNYLKNINHSDQCPSRRHPQTTDRHQSLLIPKPPLPHRPIGSMCHPI